MGRVSSSSDFLLTTLSNIFISAWFTYSDKVDLRERQLELGVDPPRLTRLPEDVWNSQSPFAALEGTGITGYVDSWLNVPLYSNIYTGTIPAIVHMNGKLLRNPQRHADADFDAPQASR